MAKTTGGKPGRPRQPGGFASPAVMVNPDTGRMTNPGPNAIPMGQYRRRNAGGDMAKPGRPSQPASMNRGLLGQVEDSLANPLDFNALPALSYSPGGFQSVSVGKTPLIRDRNVLATRAENYLGDFNRAFENIDSRYGLADPNSYAGAVDRMEQATYDRAFNLLSPDLERQENRMRTDLANRGLAPTSQAYRDMFGQYSDRRARALNDLSLGAVMAGAQEHQRLADLTARNRAQLFGERQGLYGAGMGNLTGIEGLNQAEEAERARMAQRQLALRQQQAAEADAAFQQSLVGRQQGITEQRLARQQPLSDLASLLAGVAPGGIPQMPGYARYSTPAPDIMGLMGSNYAARAGRPSGFGSTLSGLGTLAGGIGSLGGLFSDRRLKEDVERVGELAPGVGLYVYRYRGNPTSFMGAMADEVERFAPEAVGDYAGVKTVNYRTLARKLRQAGEVSEREAA